MNYLNKLANLFSCILLAVLLGGCADTVSEPEESVEERIESRWAHLIERDFESAWGFYTPGFREANSHDMFATDMLQRPIRWTSAELIGVECEELACDALVRVTYRVAGLRHGMDRLEVPTTVEERWVFLDGNWWYLSR